MTPAAEEAPVAEAAVPVPADETPEGAAAAADEAEAAEKPDSNPADADN